MHAYGVDKIYGWDLSLWKKFFQLYENKLVEDWKKHVSECLIKNTGYDKAHESIRMKNEIESFNKRSEINSLFYCFLNSKQNF